MLFEYRIFIFDWPELMLLPGAAITLTSMILMAVIEPRLDEIGRPSTGGLQPRRPNH
jgi:hypothetical protein